LDATEVIRLRKVDLAGAAHLVLADGVAFLDPQTAVFEAMLEGWDRQQRSRFLRESTVKPRLDLVRRFATFTGLYPWQWTPAELEAFTSSLVSGTSPLAHSTVRSYQITLRMFCEFITDPRYGWATQCQQRFGQAPAQIAHEWNTVAHLAEYEGRPGRRALTYDEVQALFDAADGLVDQIRARGRKGSLAALRDAVMLKTTYAYGLRRRETVMLDQADLRRNPRGPPASPVRVGPRPVWESIAGWATETSHGADSAGDGLDRRRARRLVHTRPGGAQPGCACRGVRDRAAQPSLGYLPGHGVRPSLNIGGIAA
jgi:integrase